MLRYHSVSSCHICLACPRDTWRSRTSSAPRGDQAPIDAEVGARGMAPGQVLLDAGPAQLAQSDAPPMLAGHRKTLDDAENPPYHAYRSAQQAIVIRRTARSRYATADRLQPSGPSIQEAWHRTRSWARHRPRVGPMLPTLPGPAPRRTATSASRRAICSLGRAPARSGRIPGPASAGPAARACR